ncbi:efflux RND transporter periplasmic adaptor subunit, partial [Acidithiobacillus ferrooxidans]|nr:efflux RND transporter periplasmic adaptor subunit [Acidithiobacillus ferrooxidans]
MNTWKQTARIAALIFAVASLAACSKSPPEAPLAQGKV